MNANAAVEMVQGTLANHFANTARYARCISASKRVRWDIDADVIRGRQFDLSQRFLPNGLSRSMTSPFLTKPRSAPAHAGARPHLCANSSGWSSASSMRRCSRSVVTTGSATRRRSRRWSVSATRSSSTRSCSAGSRRMIAAVMPAGYRCRGRAERHRCLRARQVDLGGARPHLLHRALHAEALHRRASTRAGLSALWKDIFLSTGRKSASTRCSMSSSGSARTRSSTPSERDRAVDDLIDLVGAVDGMLQGQADGRLPSTSRQIAGRAFTNEECRSLSAACCMLTAGSTSGPACSTRTSRTCSGSSSACSRQSASAPRLRRFSERDCDRGQTLLGSDPNSDKLNPVVPFGRRDRTTAQCRLPA